MGSRSYPLGYKNYTVVEIVRSEV